MSELSEDTDNTLRRTALMLRDTNSTSTPAPQNHGHEDWRQPKPTDKRFIDIEGQTFGDWSVLGYAGKRGLNAYWWCRCTSCQKEKAIYGCALRSGNKASCECRKHSLRPRANHGMSSTKEYQTWRAMIERCERIGGPSWNLYGGRGIEVCSRWGEVESGFFNFLADMGLRPEKRSLDRVDVDGNYEPENCRWATAVEQARNRRNNRMLTYKGRTQSMAAWASEFALSPKCLRFRLSDGWELERALTTPSRGVNLTKITYQGRTQSISAWAREYGLCLWTLAYRLRSGWRMKQALVMTANRAKV